MFRATVSGGRFATRTSHDDNTRSSHNEGTFARIMRHETREAKDGQTEEKKNTQTINKQIKIHKFSIITAGGMLSRKRMLYVFCPIIDMIMLLKERLAHANGTMTLNKKIGIRL